MTGAALGSGATAANETEVWLVYRENEEQLCEGFSCGNGESKDEGGRELLKMWIGDRDFLKKSEFT